MENFSLWIQKELQNRNWNQATLARKSRLDPAVISNLVNEKRGPGEDTCRALARAFGYDPEDVFRIAGLLPPKDKLDIEIEKARYMLARLPDPVRRVLIDSIETQYERWENENKKGLAPAPRTANP